MAKHVVLSPSAPAPVGPYSQAVIANGFVFLAGQIPLDPVTGDLVTGDTAMQTRRVMENLRAVLEASGASLRDVVKTTVFMTDLADFPAMNAIYAEYFGMGDSPARSTVQVAALPKGARVEIEAVAVLPMAML